MYLNYKILLSLVIFLISLSRIAGQDNIDFRAESLSGKNIHLSEIYSENLTIVNFWALWCKPCRTEIKALKELNDKYFDKGIRIIGINQDSPRSLTKVESFVSSQKIDYEVILDPNQELFELFGGQVVPLTLLYDKTGKVIYQNIGYLPGDEIKLEAEIRKALGL